VHKQVGLFYFNQFKMARPSIISEAIIKKAEKYLKKANDTRSSVNLPTVEGLCLAIGISKQCAYEWQSKAGAMQGKDLSEVDQMELKLYFRFNDLLGVLHQKQCERLINKGLAGKYNSSIVKLLLGKHGYKDEVNQRGSELQYEIDWSKVTDKQQAFRIASGEDPLVVLKPDQFK
jgi:hypothetical protein